MYIYVCVCVSVCARAHVCAWVTLLYSRKLTKHCKPTIMEKIKITKESLLKVKISNQMERNIMISISREVLRTLGTQGYEEA